MSYKASYLQLLESGDLVKRVDRAREHISACRLCPHDCRVDRRSELGVCRAGDRALVASHGSHMGEESIPMGTIPSPQL